MKNGDNFKFMTFDEVRVFSGARNRVSPTIAEKKPNNNEPCICQSGRKYKYCCKYKKK